MIRTDLATEIQQEKKFTPEHGIETEEFQKNGLSVSTVKVITEDAAKKFGKEIGEYTTVEFDGTFTDNEKNMKAAELVTDILKRYIPSDKTVLAVGLGNSALTADSIGPKTVEKLIVTHHLKTHAPQIYSEMGLGDLCTVCPGVLAKTGIESLETVKAAVESVKPEVTVIIDALAARHVKRLCSTVQISNTGICPGAGVGNTRQELSEKTLGVKVVTIGIPTVVDAATLTTDTLAAVSENTGAERLTYGKVKEILNPYELNMIVTSKDVDVLAEKCANLLSHALNGAIHGNLSSEEIEALQM